MVPAAPVCRVSAPTVPNVCQNGGQVCEQNQPAGTEGPFGDATCADGLDNDCDGLTDAADPDCDPVPEICDDGIDNSGNGLVDCADPACDGFVGGACDTGNSGICAAGTTACRELQEFCDQNQQAVPEGPFDSPTCTRRSGQRLRRPDRRDRPGLRCAAGGL